MRGEIKLDWSEAYIPMGKKRVKLEPEPKNKYIMVPSDNPKEKILFEEFQFGNYVILPENQCKVNEVMNCEDVLWTLEFDGSYSNLRSGAGVILISPSGDIFPFSFKLDFHNTNNTAEYEALLLGLQEAKSKGVKQLKVRGDAKLIMKQVKNQFFIKNDRLKYYRNLVWDEIEPFEAFYIEFIPCAQNTKADSLAISASLLLPHPEFKSDTFKLWVR